MDFQEFPDSWDLKTKINYLQRKIILNSIAYYMFDTNFLSDRYYDLICKQLVRMHEEYGDISDTEYGYVYYDFDGSTGFDLYYRLDEDDKEYLTNITAHQVHRGRQNAKSTKKTNKEDEEEKVTEIKKSKDFLYPHQREALKKMFNGCILNGGTGSGKSRTGIYYFFQKNGGRIENQEYIPMQDNPPDLLIITTSKKRNDLEWEGELAHFTLYPDKETKLTHHGNRVIIDSWQNVKKYADVKGMQIIFDEDKVQGKGVWVKSFLKMAKNNEWIILSATSGDKWEDYIPVFIANGFYKNRTEFSQEHLVYSRYAKFPKVEGYRNEWRLMRLRDKILVDMDFERHTTQIHETIWCDYDMQLYRSTMRSRTNPYKQGYIPCTQFEDGALRVGFDIDISDIDPVMPGWEFEIEHCEYVRLINEPIQQAAGLCFVLRKIVNSDDSRQAALLELLDAHPKAIIFYNFDYELDILLNLVYPEGTKVAQYNGHKHEKLPEGDRWVYLTQYTSGCEAWNTITTDTIIFYSENYSYKVMVQAAGRIDRLTTPYTDLRYFHLKSKASIDLAISKAISQKKKFNERKFTRWDK